MKRAQKAPWRPAIRVLPALPIEISLFHRPPLVSLERSKDDHVFRCCPGPLVQATIIEEQIGKNVYQMRDEFLRVRTPAEAFEFLSSYSWLLEPQTSERKNEFELVVSWTDYLRWQRLLGEISIGGFLYNPEGKVTDPGWRFLRGGRLPDELQGLFSANLPETTSNWLKGIASHIDIRKHAPRHLKLYPDEGPGKCTVEVGSVVDAILATIYFNDLVGINYKKCSCEGCDEIYEERTRHERNFCSTKCAHTQGTRDRRLAAKLAKQEAAKKPSAKRTVKKTVRKING